jgi:hypothetical protein
VPKNKNPDQKCEPVPKGDEWMNGVQTAEEMAAALGMPSTAEAIADVQTGEEIWATIQAHAWKGAGAPLKAKRSRGSGTKGRKNLNREEGGKNR